MSKICRTDTRKVKTEQNLQNFPNIQLKADQNMQMRKPLKAEERMTLLGAHLGWGTIMISTVPVENIMIHSTIYIICKTFLRQ